MSNNIISDINRLKRTIDRFDLIVAKINAYLMFLAKNIDTSWALPFHNNNEYVVSVALSDGREVQGLHEITL